MRTRRRSTSSPSWGTDTARAACSRTSASCTAARATTSGLRCICTMRSSGSSPARPSTIARRSNSAWRRLVGRRIARREHVAGPVAALPVRHRGLALGTGREPRALDELEPMDVARAVRKDLRRPHADDALCPRVLGAGAGRRGRSRRCRSGAAGAGPSKSTKSRPTWGFSARFPSERYIPLPSKLGKASVCSSRTRTKPGSPPLYEHCGAAVRVGGREEEHVARLDEGAVVLVDAVVDDPLLDPIREASRVEPVLEAATAVVVEASGSCRHLRPGGGSRRPSVLRRARLRRPLDDRTAPACARSAAAACGRRALARVRLARRARPGGGRSRASRVAWVAGARGRRSDRRRGRARATPTRSTPTTRSSSETTARSCCARARKVACASRARSRPISSKPACRSRDGSSRRGRSTAATRSGSIERPCSWAAATGRMPPAWSSSDARSRMPRCSRTTCRTGTVATR